MNVFRPPPVSFAGMFSRWVLLGIPSWTRLLARCVPVGGAPGDMTALLPRSRADSPGWRVVDANDVLPPVIGQALVDESRQEVRVGDLHEVSSVRTGMMTCAREGSATDSSYAMGTVSRIDR